MLMLLLLRILQNEGLSNRKSNRETQSGSWWHWLVFYVLKSEYSFQITYLSLVLLSSMLSCKLMNVLFLNKFSNGFTYSSAENSIVMQMPCRNFKYQLLSSNIYEKPQSSIIEPLKAPRSSIPVEYKLFTKFSVLPGTWKVCVFEEEYTRRYYCWARRGMLFLYSLCNFWLLTCF